MSEEVSHNHPEIKTGPFYTFNYYGALLKYVPEAIKTRDFCIDVLSERRYGYTEADKTMVNSIPDIFKDTEFYFEVIQRQREAFEYVRVKQDEINTWPDLNTRQGKRNKKHGREGTGNRKTGFRIETFPSKHNPLPSSCSLYHSF
jgi:hypothetical protein